MKNLGYANGWSETPEMITKCKEAQKNGEKHDIKYENIGRCLNQTTCNTCGYTYKVDSSG